MRRRAVGVAALLALAAAPSAAAQEGDSAVYTPEPLFTDDAPLALTLTANLHALYQERDTVNERGALLQWARGPGDTVAIPIEIRVRGHFRASKRNCSYPNIRLDFPGKKSAGTPFAGQDKVKLVNPCRRGDQYEQYILQEYLAYRMYRELTPHSYQVRLARMVFRDSTGRVDPREAWVFLIESDESLARRIGGIEYEIRGATMDHLDTAQTALMSLFQYMIGNTDWSIPALHNIRLYGGHTGAIPVAYDFDWSGIVWTRYARPNEMLPIENVRQRLYRGYCMHEARVVDALTPFRERRDAIFALVRDFPPLDRRARGNMLDYLEDFYDVVEDRGIFSREILRACLG